MKINYLFLTGLAAAAGLWTGCETFPPGAERGPHGTMAYDVLIEATEPGARIEVNGESIGNAPVHIKVFGDTDGTFHDFGSYYYAVRAFPLSTNQFVQTRVFRTGRDFAGEDVIPKKIFFEMSQPAPVTPVLVLPHPGYSPYGPTPYYYGAPYRTGPEFRFFFGAPIHRRYR